MAPGIAEALVATAFGLFAAIPALIFFNMFSQRVREIRAHMEDFGLEFYNLASEATEKQMAFSNRNRQEESIADINITPFVDVVLVLLIIFMITAGVVEFGLEIDVPRTREVASTSEDYDFVNITSDGQLYLNTEPISIYDIAPRIKERQGEEGPGVYVRAHKGNPLGSHSPGCRRMRRR